MKIVFSEAAPDYAGYVFPYAIWAYPEPGETPERMLASGFLPSLGDLTRYYLCRQVRVRLPGFHPNSENRRILRKGDGIAATIVPRDRFEATEDRIRFCHAYATCKWSTPPSRERIERVFTNPITSHVCVFSDAQGAEVGMVTLLESQGTWFYSNAFYDPDHPFRSLGAYLMTETIRILSQEGASHLHLGTCYSRAALYKTQFPGVEFFNGFRWSDDLDELKYLIERQEKEIPGHLLEDDVYHQKWTPDGGLGSAKPFGYEIH
ncbi:MAG TPA: GNAT family N-acetyltransferase [Fibrobacteria bacterium]|nr:GNAT family N-acetyltransferase [Fibrobacteria bacterium]HOX52599.1 GNAT family N-acetyltransferase [Fibrobacteria bacterium]